MKLHLPSQREQRANGLLITLIMIGLVGLPLLVYLRVVSYQNFSTMRSQVWNAAIPIIEAGVEDALTQINTHGATNITCDGWTQSGNIWYVLRALGDNYYLTTISNYVSPPTNICPVIESRALIRLPAQFAALPGPMLAAILSKDGMSQYLARGVRITTRSDHLFNKGLVAKGKIDLNGNNIDSDSFDSSDPNHSTDGRYSWIKRKANGDIATNLTLTNSLSVGNANVYGRVSTGPHGTVSIGPNGSVGGLLWHIFGNHGIQDGYSTDDMNVDFPNVVMPSTAGASSPGSGTVGGLHYDLILNSGKYYVDEIDASDKNILVTSNATLIVLGNMKMTGQSRITINTNGCLNLYVGGPTANLGGNGVINETGNATNFFYHGGPNNTSISLSGNGTFVGILYAPSADLSLNGGGSSDEDFCGASVTKTATMNGHFKFHYDEALDKYGPFRGFIVTSWNEMSPADVDNMPVDLDDQL
jgi:hypothetical protein